ncbi:hypothetical protein [Gemmatimonas sp.]
MATDTAVVGATLQLTGEQLPATPAQVRVTLDGVVLPVKALSASAVELDVPAAFACRAAQPVALEAQLGTTRFATTVVLRVAQRLQLDAGETYTVAGVAQRACVELVGTGAAGTSRFVVAVVNGSAAGNAAPAYTLSGTGTGTLAGVASAIRNPDAGSPVALRSGWAGATSGPVAGALALGMAAANDEQAHTLLAQHEAVRHAAPATALWQARAAQSTRFASLRRALGEGDTTTLSAINGSCAKGHPVKARVVYVGSRATVLEDMSAPRAGTMDATYRQLGLEYDQVVHPLLEANVGNPLAMNATMGGDGRVVMLFTRFVNDSMSGTAGYVSACNFYPRGTFAGSNEAAVVYGRVAGAQEAPAEWRRTMRGTVVHEAKHLASFAERLVRGRDFEEPWLEEATARVAEELYARTFARGAAWRGNTGFAESVQCEVTQCDDRPLVMWKHFTGLHAWLRTTGSARVGQVSGEAGAALSATAANAGYASGWALVRWVLDRHAVSERDLLRQLVAGERAAGVQGLAAAAGMSEQALLTQWAVSIGSDAGLRSATTAAPLSSWQYGDIIGGMASMFPGVFSAQPLAAMHRSAGAFSLPQSTVSGTAHYLTIEGNVQQGSQLLELVPATPGTLGLAIRRAQ